MIRKAEKLIKKNDLLLKVAEIVSTIGLIEGGLQESNYQDDVLLTGLLDSYGFIQYITTVEADFDIEFSEDDQFDSRIRSIEGMADFILSRVD